MIRWFSSSQFSFLKGFNTHESSSYCSGSFRHQFVHDYNLPASPSPFQGILLCGALGGHMFWHATSHHICAYRSSLVTYYVHDFLRLTFMYLIGVSGQANRKSFQERWCLGSHQVFCHQRCLQKSWSRRLSQSWSLTHLQWARLNRSLNGLVYFMLYSFQVYREFFWEL